MEKHNESRLSYLFAHLHLLSSDSFSSDSSHLCFSTVHIVGSFTSKLPSMIYYDIFFINQNYLNQLTLQMFSNSDTLSTLLKIQIEDGATLINVSSSYKVAPSYNIVMEIHEHKWGLNISFLHILFYSFTCINGLN